MSAAQSLGRVCQDCRASIEGSHASTRYCATCSTQRFVERKRASNRRRKRVRSREKSAIEHAAEIKSLDPHARQVTSAHDLVKTRPQVICRLCRGMPWARTTRRCNELFEPIAAVAPFTGPVAPKPVCRGCGEPYADEPAPEPCNVLGSSAGTAVREGKLYGIASEPERFRASRARYK